MKHAILGAGAIGGLMGAALGFLDEDVTLIVRPEKLPGFPETITLEQPSGTITAPVKAVSRLTTPVDVLWIATKTYQLQPALDAVAATPGVVVPLLNGIDHVAVLRSRFGDDRVIPATISVEADRVAEGRFVQRSPVRLSMAAAGEGLLGPLLARVGDRFGFTCNFVENEQTLLWRKLCFLGPFALTTSASRLDKGAILGDPQWKGALDSALAEAAAVATASGAEIDTLPIEKIFESLPTTARASMAKDLIAGRPLELDAIGGSILRAAAKHGIAVPTTKRLVGIIQEQASASGRAGF